MRNAEASQKSLQKQTIGHVATVLTREVTLDRVKAQVGIKCVAIKDYSYTQKQVFVHVPSKLVACNSPCPQDY